MERHFITYEEALEIIYKNTDRFETVQTPLAECVGHWLAEDLVADRDFPPFDRVTMDGIAIAYTSYDEGKRSFEIEAVAAAGEPQKTLLHPQKCVEVMTGAILPKGVDTVIRYEDIRIKEGIATFVGKGVRAKQNVHIQGGDIPKGSTITTKGKQLSGAEVMLAATIGKTELKVYRLPKVAVCATGDELVPVSATPEPHQIRSSNVHGLQAMFRQWGISADVFHLKDDKDAMQKTVSELLERYETLVFSGGVSKGKFDYLPGVFRSIGIKECFHKVKQRPGKPFWFGKHGDGTLVFALPGNPVSTFVCTNIYIRFWMYRALGITPDTLYVKLVEDVIFPPELTYFPEAKIRSLKDGTLTATVIKGNGSGDFTNLTRTDGFLILPRDKELFAAGERYPFVPYRNLGY